MSAMLTAEQIEFCRKELNAANIVPGNALCDMALSSLRPEQATEQGAGEVTIWDIGVAVNHLTEALSFHVFEDDGRTLVSARCLERVKDARTLLLRATPAKPDDEAWRPIESAPKDRVIWAIDTRPGVNAQYSVRWNFHSNSYETTWDATRVDPSHWMPLPAAPAHLDSKVYK